VLKLSVGEFDRHYHGLTSTLQSLEVMARQPESLVKRLFASKRNRHIAEFDQTLSLRDSVASDLAATRRNLAQIIEEADNLSLKFHRDEAAHGRKAQNLQNEVQDWPEQVTYARNLLFAHPYLVYLSLQAILSLVHMMIDRAQRAPLKPAKRSAV
jgi:hypothetical protein